MRAEEGQKLPAGWRWVKLGELVSSSQAGFACGERDPEGCIQLRMNNLDTSGHFVWNDFLRVPATEDQITQYSLNVGDVLFNNTNSTDLVGKSALFSGHSEPVLFSNHFNRLRVRVDLIDPIILAYWLQLQWERRTFANICNRWIGQSAVKSDKLFSLLLPLPPLPEQKRIAAILTEKMAAIEKARAAAEERLKAAKELPAAYPREVFERTLKVNEHRTVTIDEITDLVRGSSPRPQGDKRYYGGTVPRLMVADVTRDGMYITPRIDFLTDLGSTLSRPMKKDDVVMVVSGAPGLPGILAVDACIHDGFVGFKNLNSNVIANRYLYHFLNYVRYTTDSQATGAIFRNLTTDQIKRIEIPVPCLAVQEALATELADKSEASHRLISMLKDEVNTIENLPSAILRQAFAGEL